MKTYSLTHGFNSLLNMENLQWIYYDKNKKLSKEEECMKNKTK